MNALKSDALHDALNTLSEKHAIDNYIQYIHLRYMLLCYIVSKYFILKRL